MKKHLKCNIFYNRELSCLVAFELKLGEFNTKQVKDISFIFNGCNDLEILSYNSLIRYILNLEKF